MSRSRRTHQGSGQLSPVIIQVDIPPLSDLTAELNRTRATLQAAGILLDAHQPATRIGTKESRRYVLRGRATQKAIEQANATGHVLVFPDLEVREP
jgi:hypothetical protein